MFWFPRFTFSHWYLLTLVQRILGLAMTDLVYTGLAVGAVGMTLWILSILTLGHSLAVLPGTDRLVTHGVYRYLRHPIYIGIILTLGGLFLACGSTICLVYVFVVVVPLNVFQCQSRRSGFARTTW